jgi:hemerythrin superfamily protein
MDIYEVLTEDHREVQKMLNRLAGTSENAIKTREKTFGALKEALIAHTKAEDKVFYSTIDHDQGHELVDEARHEHQEVEQLLEEMSKMDVSSQAWSDKLRTLKESVEHHVEEEEQQIFKEAHRMLDEDEADSMGDEMEEEEEKLLKH